jgi:hypothetical protein
MLKGNEVLGAEPGVQLLVAAGHWAWAAGAANQLAEIKNSGAKCRRRRNFRIQYADRVGDFTALNVAT